MISNTLYIIGSVVLIHAGYSSYESHQLVSSLNKSIVHETLYGIAFIIVASVYSIKNSPFYTIRGKHTTEADGVLNDIIINEPIDSGHEFLKPIEMKDAVSIIEKIGVNNHEQLISRVEFIDVVKKRKEFAKWSSEREL